MLTLDAVRTAVLSDQPWSRLDELVRAELTSGRTTRQIYKSLMEMADEIDATPDLPEDGSDAFGDVLDALTGFCRAEHQYKDPPNVTLPTEEEIAKLPRWARVAFAARCARRVSPLYKHFWREAPSEWIRAITFACEITEGAATSCGTEPEGVNVKHAAQAAHAAVAVVPQATSFVSALDVASASSLAADSTYTAINGRTDSAVYLAVSAAQQAAERVFNTTPILRRDFDHLARLAEAQRWDDDTPVPPEVFGPLWAEGPPKGWPQITDVPQRAELVIEAFARERATEQIIEDDVVNLFNALNRYHIARSGVRLTLEQFRSLLPALVTAEV